MRDLCRGETPADADMVSKATPEEVEELFEHTVGVGRAFGIVVVVQDGVPVELDEQAVRVLVPVGGESGSTEISIL